MFGYSKNRQESLHALLTKSGNISFLLRKSRRRTMSIAINTKAQVIVSAPLFLKETEVASFIKKKSDWIVEKIQEIKKRNCSQVIKKYEEGEEFLFLGKKCKLRIVEEKIKRSCIDFDGLTWRVSVPWQLPVQEKERIVKDKLVEWYRRQAEEILGGRIFHYSRILKVDPKEIAVKTQKRLWGICDYRKKIIRLNWLVILAPLDVVDYVVVHELCHLLVPNHSKVFWKKVASVYPRYKECKKWFKENASLMVLP